MSRSRPLTRSRVIAMVQHGESPNLHVVEIIPEPINTQHSTKLLSLLLKPSITYCKTKFHPNYAKLANVVHKPKPSLTQMETATRRTTRLESYESTAPETRTTKETTITGTTEIEAEVGTHQTLPTDHESSRDHSHEDIRGILDNYHPGRTPFTMRILESQIPRVLEKPHKLETYDGTTDPDGHP
ncbi:hypothetical protein P8452_60786 [Trifolium repens]|nr:hypothetical protein P8452_60786 [Trifolium repens]